jgi:hypothetical protein
MRNKIAVVLAMAFIAGLGFFATNRAVSQETNAQPGLEMPHHEFHPAIHSAILALQKAKFELLHANHDFGGHRAAALKECDAAILELKEALKYDQN